MSGLIVAERDDELVFADRIDAGRRLAAAAQQVRSTLPDDLLVVGLPRGGVPVAFEVASAWGAPLDVIVVRKLGLPSHPEYGMGAVGEQGVVVLNDQVVIGEHVSRRQFEEVERRERLEVELRAIRFRGGRPLVPMAGRPVVVVDDGVATGGTARAAVRVARAAGATPVVLAVPVGHRDTLLDLAREADTVVAVIAPVWLGAVGAFYRDFRQVPDEAVVELLERAHAGR